MRRIVGPLIFVLAASLSACGGADDARSAERADEDAPARTERPVQSPEEEEARAPDPAVSSLPGPAAADGGADDAADVGPSQTASGATRGDPGVSAGADRSADPAGGGARDPRAILTRAERRYEDVGSFQAEFVQRVTIPLLDEVKDSRGTLYLRAPDRLLMDFSEPEGDVIVSDGRFLWMYYPSTDARQVMRAAASAGGQGLDFQRAFLRDATRRYEARLEGSEAVEGRTVDVLTLVPLEPSPYRRVRIWVDREDSLVRRFEIVEENESVRRLELRQIQLNPPLADDLFRFEPPAGVQIFDGA